MRLNAVKVLGISITNASKKEVLEYIEKGLFSEHRTQNSMTKKGRNSLVIVTPNAEQLVYAKGDSHFTDILNRADVAVPDSIGVVWAMQFLGSLPSTFYPLHSPQRIPGVELMEDLVAVAAKWHVPIGLIGGRRGVAVETLERLTRKHGELRGEVFEAPEIRIVNSVLRIEQNAHDTQYSIHNTKEDEYFQQLATDILKSGVRIVFVALGPPKQEYFIEKLSNQLSVISNQKEKSTKYRLPSTDYSIALMSVGGSFDIISGRLPRAPQLVRSIGFEWLWRLLLEPKRIIRQLALLKFVWLVLRERLTSQ